MSMIYGSKEITMTDSTIFEDRTIRRLIVGIAAGLALGMIRDIVLVMFRGSVYMPVVFSSDRSIRTWRRRMMRVIRPEAGEERSSSTEFARILRPRAHRGPRGAGAVVEGAGVS